MDSAKYLPSYRFRDGLQIQKVQIQTNLEIKIEEKHMNKLILCSKCLNIINKIKFNLNRGC